MDKVDKKLTANEYLAAFIDLKDGFSMEVFQSVADTSPFPFCIIDVDKQSYFFRNHAHHEMSNYLVPTAGFLNMPFLADSDALSVFMQTIREAKIPFIEKHEYLGVGGVKFNFEVHGHPIFTGDNRHLIILHYKDITDGQKAEQYIDELRNTLTDLFTNLPGIVFRCLNEANWTMEYVSSGCKSLTGYAAEELVNNSRIKYGDIILPEDRQMVWDHIQDAIRKKRYYNIKYRITHKKGYIKWVAERGRATFDTSGRVVSIEGFITDISEGKAAEINLKKELQISEAIAHISIELLKDTVTPIKVASLVKDYTNELTNSKTSLIYYPEENNSGYTLFYETEEPITIHPDEYTPEQMQFLETLAITGNPKLINKPVTVMLPGFSDSSIEVSRLMSVPAFINNRLTGLLILCNAPEDYTDETAALAQRFINMFALGLYRLKAEETLQDAKKKAEESDRLKSLFLSNMSHEIRTPMNAIVGFAEMLQDSDLDIDQKNKFLEVIIKSGDNLLRLINDIIDISRIEAGQLKLDYADCLVNEMINDLETYFKQEIIRQRKQHINLYTQIGHPESDFTLSTDCVRLKQVLNNLIGNAIKFTDDGFIEFGYRIITGQIEFFVRDSGIGIATDKQKLIFERFGQVREAISRNQAGTGLGLTISKNLVEKLGGNIWVDSIPGEGSTFYFTLPLRLGMRHIESTRRELETEVKQSIDLHGKTILIVEDVDTNFFYLSSLLQKHNCRILRANNGKKAVDMVLEDASINLVLMDIELPVMDGYQATREIKKIKPDLPVIAQTAFAMLGERERSKEAGCVDYIAKPIRKEELISILRKYI